MPVTPPGQSHRRAFGDRPGVRQCPKMCRPRRRCLNRDGCGRTSSPASVTWGGRCGRRDLVDARRRCFKPATSIVSPRRKISVSPTPERKVLARSASRSDCRRSPPALLAEDDGVRLRGGRPPLSPPARRACPAPARAAAWSRQRHHRRTRGARDRCAPERRLSPRSARLSPLDSSFCVPRPPTGPRTGTRRRFAWHVYERRPVYHQDYREERHEHDFEDIETLA